MLGALVHSLYCFFSCAHTWIVMEVPTSNQSVVRPRSSEPWSIFRMLCAKHAVLRFSRAARTAPRVQLPDDGLTCEINLEIPCATKHENKIVESLQRLLNQTQLGGTQYCESPGGSDETCLCDRHLPWHHRGDIALNLPRVL